ncbi:hypothetical protein GCM10027563_29920 [Parasphingorhabdus pacifica]
MGAWPIRNRPGLTLNRLSLFWGAPLGVIKAYDTAFRRLTRGGPFGRHAPRVGHETDPARWLTFNT